MRRRRLLVVDDEEAIRLATTHYFRGKGFDVDCASEMEEAAALLTHVPYDAVVADMRLTGIQGTEGLDLVTHVRDVSPSTRITILTAYASPQLELEAMRRGADRFLRKPLPLASLAAVVLELIAGADSE